MGHKCAGKTTFSDYFASLTEAVPIEASKVLRSLAWESEETIEGHDGALQFLEQHGMDCVAKKVGEHIERTQSPLRLVTGLRTIEEVLYLKRRFPEAEIVLIEGDPRIRFERHLKRARDQDVKTFKDFLTQDEWQAKFGFMRVPHELADDVIMNEGTMIQYESKIKELLSHKSQPRKDVAESLSELHRCLIALKVIGRSATCDAISTETARQGTPVRRYNINRALKSVPEFAQRVERSSDLLKYKITGRGLLLLELMNLVHERIETTQF